jgi:hypothetical protein
LISIACCSMVASMPVNDFISVPTSSVRVPSPSRVGCADRSSAIRPTVRPRSQMSHAPPTIAITVKKMSPSRPTTLAGCSASSRGRT